MNHTEPLPVALILGGGLALGAYQAGVLAALETSREVRIVAVTGASIGAINGALLAGNRPPERVNRLRGFWDRVTTDLAPGWLEPAGRTGPFRHARNWVNTLGTHLAGARGLYRPRIFFDSGPSAVPSFYDSSLAAATLAQLVDFDVLNGGAVRYCAVATDVETAAAVPFDTAAGVRIGIPHLLASSALMPSFAPVAIDGRLYADGGLAANAPLELFLSSARVGPLPPLCILIDLFAPQSPPPRTLEAAMARGSDLKFAAQTRLRLEAIERERSLEAALALPAADAADEGPAGAAPGTELIYLSYRPLAHDAGSEKQYDFSRPTLADRWQRGEDDAAEVLRMVAAVAPAAGAQPGLRIHRCGAWVR